MPWAELSDVRCYYELLGEGEPVLLIAGLGSTCRVWDSLAPELAPHFSLILPDNRDIGNSVGRREPHSLADFSADLVELLDSLQVDATHIIGISLGGVIAQQFAMDHPHRVNRLVLMSCANRFGPYLTDIAKLLGHTVARLPVETYLRTIELLGTSPEFYDEHYDEITRNIQINKANGVSRGAIIRQLRCLAMSEVPRSEFIITAPTLVLAGEYDALIPNYYARRMAGEIPGAQFRILKGCGHNLAMEAPLVVSAQVIEFLQRSGVEECPVADVNPEDRRDTIGSRTLQDVRNSQCQEGHGRF